MNFRWLLAGSVALVVAAAVPVLGALPGGMGYGPGAGMMGGGCAWGPGGGWTGSPGGGQPLSLDQAARLARSAVAALGNPRLVPAHIMEFTANFYVAVKDTSTGRGAFELLVDRYTGAVHPEPGPNMMWNTEYGHMRWATVGPGAMMGPGLAGGGRPGVPATPALTLEDARKAAQRFLDARMPGTRTEEAIAFPGYYTIDVVRGGKVIGMLSVNVYTGQVWYHTWHGTFIQEKDLD